MISARPTLKNHVLQNVLIALNYIENAHEALSLALKDEKNVDNYERNQLYDYGLGYVDIHKVKLANIKKAILSISGNKRYKDLKETDHAESLA